MQHCLSAGDDLHSERGFLVGGVGLGAAADDGLAGSELLFEPVPCGQPGQSDAAVQFQCPLL